MMDAPIALILETLSKMAKESELLTRRNDLISLFCLRVIPFILEHPLLEAIRSSWHERWGLLQADAIQAENKAVEVYVGVFAKIKESLRINSDLPEAIKDQIHLIDHLIARRSGSYPFSQGLYEEIFNLTHLLLDAGFVDVCRQFCKISTKIITIPNSKKTLLLCIAKKTGSYQELTLEEHRNLQMKEAEYIYFLPGIDTVNEYMLVSWNLESLNSQVHRTQQALSSHYYQDAACGGILGML